MESGSRLLYDLFRLGIDIPCYSRRGTADAAIPHGRIAFHGSRPRDVLVDAFHRDPFAVMERVEGSNPAGCPDVSARLRLLVLGGAANPVGDCGGYSCHDSGMHHASG